MNANQLIKEMGKLANPKKAKILQSFFKTGPGGYGEGDIFLGVVVPEQRKLVKKYKDLPLKDIQTLLKSRIHEHRLTGLLILVKQYEALSKHGDEKGKKQIFDLYVKNAKLINNWDLVDLTAPNIVGNYLLDKDRKLLLKLAKSRNLWERRISILATFAFIRNGESRFALDLYEMFIKDTHDLIHKAVGWMLREVGKRVSQADEEVFLKKHCKTMPRTMLRYAIEKFDEKKKNFYMTK